jgi:ribonuclease Y
VLSKWLRRKRAVAQAAREEADRLWQEECRLKREARKEAENIKKESMLQAKENLLRLKTEFENETQDRPYIIGARMLVLRSPIDR